MQDERLAGHIIDHFRQRFPGSHIDVDYDGEDIWVYVGNATYFFECGSDDDAYVFHNTDEVFDDTVTVPLLPE